MEFCSGTMGIGPPDDFSARRDALHPSTDPLSDSSANCIVPVTRSLALNHPNRRPLIIRGAIKEANAASTRAQVRPRGFPTS